MPSFLLPAFVTIAFVFLMSQAFAKTGSTQDGGDEGAKAYNLVSSDEGAREKQDEKRVPSPAFEAMEKDLYHSTFDGSLGKKTAKILIVQFFDYNCGFCKKASREIEGLVTENSNLRFIMKELPVLGEESEEAHKVSLAVQKIAPEKYMAFHSLLMQTKERINGEKALSLAHSIGINKTTLEKKMNNPELIEAFRITFRLARDLQIEGVPSYVVGQEIIQGSLDTRDWKQKIMKLEKKIGMQ